MGRQRILFIACLAASLCHGSLAARAGITIQHQPVGCLVAEKFPTLESRLDPADDVASARVYFKGQSGSAWYYVEMKRDPAGGFRGVLPQPKKDLARVTYYIETTAKDLTSARTDEFAPDVVASAASCKAGRTLATAVGSASVVVGAVSGAPAIPLGFSASGVAAGAAGGAATGAGAAGGGLGTPVIVVGAAAVVAGAAVVVAKKVGGDCGTGPNSLTVLERSATTLRLQWSVEQPPASGCYTVDYLTGVASCSSAFPQHNNILPLQGTSVNLTGLTPDTMYHIHLHPLSACNGMVSTDTDGPKNVVFVRTLPAGSGPQPTTRSDYESCGCG